MALTLYTNKQSRGVVVDWLLLDLGIEVERIEVAYGAEMKSAEFLKLNPFGKLGTIENTRFSPETVGAKSVIG